MRHIASTYFKYWINTDIFAIKMCDFAVFTKKLNNCNTVPISNTEVDKPLNRKLGENKKETMCWGQRGC